MLQTGRKEGVHPKHRHGVHPCSSIPHLLVSFSPLHHHQGAPLWCMSFFSSFKRENGVGGFVRGKRFLNATVVNAHK